MSEPFIGEVRIFPYNFNPRNWAYCNGGLISISQNPALFSIIGTVYGGDGRISMGLPNLKGRTPMNAGQAPGLSFYREGWYGGFEAVTLTQAEMPTHTHDTSAYLGLGDSESPANATLGIDQTPDNFFTASDSSKYTPMSASSLSNAGGGQPHENRQPYLAVNFYIALEGLYPSRN